MADCAEKVGLCQISALKISASLVHWATIDSGATSGFRVVYGGVKFWNLKHHSSSTAHKLCHSKRFSQILVLTLNGYSSSIALYLLFESNILFLLLSSPAERSQSLYKRKFPNMAPNGHTTSASRGYTNYVAYLDPKSFDQPRIGHLDLETSLIQPLCFASGTPITDLYQVIEIGESQIKPSDETIQLSSVELQAPINGRDVLAVGKNYAEHAIEFNSSGYDSSDKTDQPTHPVIFTKRATSIIAHGEPILPHPGFTDTVDYEGEIGVIIGKSGFKIEEENAMDYVWGYTIINDMTARERQRDHKQFYIGKSPDTFCPMVSLNNAWWGINLTTNRDQLQFQRQSSRRRFEYRLR